MRLDPRQRLRTAGPARPWQLVARREVLVKLTDKTFLASTAAMLVLIAAVLGFQAYQSSRTQTFELAASAKALPMARAVARLAPDLADKTTVRVRQLDSPAQAASALKNGKADGWLRPVAAGWVLTGQDEVDPTLRSVTEQAVTAQVIARNAARAGTSVEALRAGSRLRVELVADDAARNQLADLLGFAMAFLFYFAALTFGITLASSVVEEKQSRIVEIIATSISIRALLAGKLVGMTALVMGQLLLYAVIGMVGLTFTDLGAALPAVAPGIGWFLVFFLAGFVVIACMYAVAGALASRVEDVQATSAPATTLILASFFAALLLEGRAQAVFSYVPPFSALMMPARVVAGEAQWWEALLALVLLALTAVVVVRTAARLYRRALLQTSGRLRVRQAWTAET